MSYPNDKIRTRETVTEVFGRPFRVQVEVAPYEWVDVPSVPSYRLDAVSVPIEGIAYVIDKYEETHL